jgi:hypothetical protein
MLLDVAVAGTCQLYSNLLMNSMPHVLLSEHGGTIGFA